jgi:hypothetical protein
MSVDEPFPSLFYFTQEINPFVLLYFCYLVGLEDVGQLLDDVFAINTNIKTISLPLAITFLEDDSVCFRHLFMTVALDVISLYVFFVTTGLISPLIQTLLVL